MKKKTSPSQSKKLKKLDIVESLVDADIITADPTDADIKELAKIVPVDIVGEATLTVSIVNGKPKKIRKKSKASEREHYVNGKEFEERIKVFYDTGNISDELADSINKIANGLSFAPNFINYSYKDDMVGDAIVKMFSALKNKKFMLNSGFSPFSYFTTIAFHAFINRIKKEKRYHEAITEYKEKVYTDTMHQVGTATSTIYVEPVSNGNEDNGE